MSLSLISPVNGMAVTHPSGRLLKEETLLGKCFPGNPYTI